MRAPNWNIDTRLDLAAQSKGAHTFTTLRRVTFPILTAGMLSSFLFAFATSFDELTIALFSSGGLDTTLLKQFWDETTMQISPVIAAVSTLLFVFGPMKCFCAASGPRPRSEPRSRRSPNGPSPQPERNAEDADLWRWFTLLMQDRRVRWCQAQDRWFVSVDNRHVATESSFGEAMRRAKARVQEQDA